MAGPLKNLRQEHFAREYASGESLASAYARAGFSGDPRWHKFNGSKLSYKPHVRARINELLEEFAEATAVKIEYLQAQLLPALRYNSQDLFGDDGRLKDIRDLPRDVAAAVKAVKFDKVTGNVVEVILADKIAAATVLLRSIGAIAETTINNSVNLGLADRLDRAMRRTDASPMVDVTQHPVRPLPAQQPQPAPASRSGKIVEF